LLRLTLYTVLLLSHTYTLQAMVTRGQKQQHTLSYTIVPRLLLVIASLLCLMTPWRLTLIATPEALILAVVAAALVLELSLAVLKLSSSSSSSQQQQIVAYLSTMMVMIVSLTAYYPMRYQVSTQLCTLLDCSFLQLVSVGRTVATLQLLGIVQLKCTVLQQ
jgi:hypothetical protein